MGYYIETKENLNKAQQLLAEHPEIKEVTQPVYDPTHKKIIVCVVQNGWFDAAAVCFSESELHAFAEPDGRPKRWLELPRELAIKLCPRATQML